MSNCWRGAVGTALTAFKVGIAWQGNPHHKNDRFRSAPLAAFTSLAQVPGIRFISLQQETGTEQLRAPTTCFAVHELGGERYDAATELLDCAAVMANLDLVVTVDSALAHLAGALGVPVWVALPGNADWRWLAVREDSPWYPTMRLFRQSQLGDWRPVFDRITHELQELLNRSPRR